jgi:hypothetical protein
MSTPLLAQAALKTSTPERQRRSESCIRADCAECRNKKKTFVKNPANATMSDER